VNASVDILIPNFNCLPWLKLLLNAVKRFPPKVPFTISVSDSSIVDEPSEWCKANGVRLFQRTLVHRAEPSHGTNLDTLIRQTDGEFMVFMDGDAIPIRDGWLDEAISALKDEKVGAVGLGYESPDLRPPHRAYVFAAFCAVRRDAFLKVGLSMMPEWRSPEEGEHFYPGEAMCYRLEDAGYKPKFTGHAACQLKDGHMNSVFHFFLSSTGLDTLCSIELRKRAVAAHRVGLSHFGLWDEFIQYIKESSARNPACALYLDYDAGLWTLEDANSKT
jgi:glycosyltransferase involved in cell wall biosynthesis